MARPLINKTKPLNHRPKVVMNKIEYMFIMNCAEKEGVSFSQFTRNALAEYLVNKGYRKGKRPLKQLDLPNLG